MTDRIRMHERTSLLVVMGLVALAGACDMEIDPEQAADQDVVDESSSALIAARSAAYVGFEARFVNCSGSAFMSYSSWPFPPVAP